MSRSPLRQSGDDSATPVPFHISRASFSLRLNFELEDITNIAQSSTTPRPRTMLHASFIFAYQTGISPNVSYTSTMMTPNTLLTQVGMMVSCLIIAMVLVILAMHQFLKMHMDLNATLEEREIRWRRTRSCRIKRNWCWERGGARRKG